MEDHSISLLKAAWTVEVVHSTLKEKAQMVRLSAYSETLTDVGRKVGRSLINREKRTGPRTKPWETSFRRQKGRT